MVLFQITLSCFELVLCVIVASSIENEWFMTAMIAIYCVLILAFLWYGLFLCKNLINDDDNFEGNQ